RTGACRTVEAWFYEVGAHTQQTTVPTGAAQGCDLIDGTEGATRSVSYDVSRLELASFKIIGPKCNNVVEMETEMARLTAKAMLDIRKSLQKKYYDLFAANAQANQSTYDTTTFGSVADGGNRVSVDPSNFNFELLRKMHVLAGDNLFPEDYLLIDGTNFWLDNDLAQYRRANDNARDEAAIFGDTEIYFDTRTLDAHVTRRSTFMVNPYNVLFYNDAWYSQDGEESILNGKKYMRSSIQDPLWSYNQNGVLTPVTYHMEVTHECSGRNDRADVIDEIRVNLSLPGVLAAGPTGFNNPVDGTTPPASVITGFMEFTAESPD
ncbi:MAG: hypothetical protein AAFO91_14705, partial [Bacteroidota bacterium]